MPYDFKDEKGNQHVGYKVGYEYVTDKPMLFGVPCDSFSVSVKDWERYGLHEGDDVVLCGAYNKSRFAVYGVYAL